jgi:hypothetical protein
MIFGWSKKFYPQIDANVDFIERELQKDRDLIRKGELALGRGNAFLLESRNVAKLLEHLQAAVRRDNLAKIRELESYTNLSEYSFRTDGVKRAIDRVFIAPPPQEEGKRIMARMAFAVSADAPTKSLNPSLLDYAAVNRLCWRVSFEHAALDSPHRSAHTSSRTHARDPETQTESVHALGPQVPRPLFHGERARVHGLPQGHRRGSHGHQAPGPRGVCDRAVPELRSGSLRLRGAERVTRSINRLLAGQQPARVALRRARRGQHTL